MQTLIIKLLSITMLMLFSLPAQAGVKEFSAWRDQLGVDARREGISLVTLQRILPTIRYDRDVIRYDRKQPEGSITFARYYRNVITSWRIKEGRRLAEQHKKLLKKLSVRYDVSSTVMLALWAIESGYGNNMGSYNVINSLATLAYDGRRTKFFRGELMEALKIVDNDRSLWPLYGSWAGAMGQCQFMPSTYSRYARDGDGDGRRDIWKSELDVLTSIAEYLSKEGWRGNKTWGTEVIVRKYIHKSKRGVDHKASLSVWKKRGIYPIRSASFPEKEQGASLIQFQGTGGRSFLVYDNFRALMRWNHSTYFAASVGLLSDAIKKGL